MLISRALFPFSLLVIPMCLKHLSFVKILLDKGGTDVVK